MLVSLQRLSLLVVCFLFNTATISRTANSQTMQSSAGPPPPGTVTVGFGTAWFVDNHGNMLTAAHVVSSCRQIRAVSTVFPVQPAVVKAIDQAHDLALLHVKTAGSRWLRVETLPTFDPLDNSSVLLLSDPSAARKLAVLGPLRSRGWAIGYPGPVTLSPIAFSMIPRGVAISPQHDWRLYMEGFSVAGESGSPLITEAGRVAGLFSEGELRPGHKPIVIANVGAGTDGGLFVPAVEIEQFLHAQGIQANEAGAVDGSATAIAGTAIAVVPPATLGAATEKLLCFRGPPR